MVQIAGLHVQSARHTILTHLQRARRATVKELGEVSGLTSTGVRQHLLAMERDGLVQATEERGRVGRPIHVYSLTEKGDGLFPKSYDLLASALLEELRERVDNEELHRILRSVANRLAAPYQQRVQGKSLPAKAEEAARILEEQGHLAQVRREDNELLIDEFSCPFPKVAHQDRAICALHVDFVSTLTGSDTRLGQSLMRGDPACTYRLRPTSGFSH